MVCDTLAMCISGIGSEMSLKLSLRHRYTLVRAGVVWRTSYGFGEGHADGHAFIKDDR